MDAATAEAKRTLSEFIAALRKRELQHTYFGVKKPFLAKDGSYEHIWLEVMLVGNDFRGHIDNTPGNDIGVRAGDTVTIRQDEISDWMIVTDEQRLIGGYTIRAFREMMTPQERADFDRETGLVFD